MLNLEKKTNECQNHHDSIKIKMMTNDLAWEYWCNNFQKYFWNKKSPFKNKNASFTLNPVS